MPFPLQSTAAVQPIFFLNAKDRVHCLVAAHQMLFLSLFLLAICLRHDFTGGMTMLTSAQHFTNVAMKLMTNCLAVNAALFVAYMSLTYCSRGFSIVVLVLVVMSAFATSMCMGITVLWRMTHIPQQRTKLSSAEEVIGPSYFHTILQLMFLLVSTWILLCTGAIIYVLARRLSRGRCEARHSLRTYLLRSTVVLCSLLLVSAVTGVIGFLTGAVYNWELIRESTILGGGLHNGLLSIFTAVVTLAAFFCCHSNHASDVACSIALALGVLGLTSSSVAYYTEEWECLAALHFLKQRPELLYQGGRHQYILLSKSTLVMFSTIFDIAFFPALLACVCCLMKWDLARMNEARIWWTSTPAREETN